VDSAGRGYATLRLPSVRGLRLPGGFRPDLVAVEVEPVGAFAGREKGVDVGEPPGGEAEELMRSGKRAAGPATSCRPQNSAEGCHEITTRRRKHRGSGWELRLSRLDYGLTPRALA
jgi:hypothetical protein